jgi:uncharacterized membrane protein
MEMAIKVMGLLPWTDWAALAAFFVGWIGYAVFARRRSTMQPSLLDITNQIRRRWMLQSTYREVRVVDGIVIQSLSTSPSFFASTTILIIGGLLAVLGTTEKASELVREIPFAARTSVLVFDMKIVLLVGIFVYAFFRFTWSLRQYTFGALLVGSLPESDDLAAMGEQADAMRQAFAERAGRVVGLAAETFNDGLRAYYFAFAAIGWFFSPLVFVVATAGVVWILYQREFRSEVLGALKG